MSTVFKHPERIETLLVRGTNWIGDAVMTTPAVRAIRKNFLNAKISLLVKPWVAPVFAASPHVDELILYNAELRMKGFFQTVTRLKNKKFDAAILLQNAFEAAFMAFLAGIPIRAGYNTDARSRLLTHSVKRTNRIRKIHQVHYYLNLIQNLGFLTYGTELEVNIAKKDCLQAQLRLDRLNVASHELLIGINPSAAYGGAKRWFPDRFAELADRLHEFLGAKVILFGGPLDRDLADRIVRLMKTPAVNIAAETRLEEAMAIIQKCRLFITNDSGLMHVAAALHRPLIALFGSTTPQTTGPWSPSARTIRMPLPCSPCSHHECPTPPARCMNGIDVDKVFQLTVQMLSSYKNRTL
jgi:heptosyltransferase-2